MRIFLVFLFFLNIVFGSSEIIDQISLHSSNAEYSKTIAFYKMLLKKHKNSFLKAAYATSLFKIGKKIEAEKIFKSLYKINPYDGAVNFYLGLIYFNNKKYKLSFFHFENAFITKFNPYHAKLYLGFIEFNQGNLGKANLHFLDVASKSMALKQIALFYSGLCQYNQIDKKPLLVISSNKLFKQSIDINPSSDVAISAKEYYDLSSRIIRKSKNKSSQKGKVNLAVAMNRESNVDRSIDSRSANVLGFAMTASVPFYALPNIIIEPLYHNFSTISLRIDPESSNEFKGSHLARLSLKYLPLDYVRSKVFYEYSTQKSYLFESMKTHKIAASYSSEYLMNLISKFQISYQIQDVSDISNKYKGYGAEFTQYIDFDPFIPFFKYKYEKFSNAISILDYKKDKFVLGAKFPLFELMVTSYIARNFQTLSSSREIISYDEIYTSIKKVLSETFHVFLNGSYERTNYDKTKELNNSAYWIGAGMNVTF